MVSKIFVFLLWPSCVVSLTPPRLALGKRLDAPWSSASPRPRISRDGQLDASEMPVPQQRLSVLHDVKLKHSLALGCLLPVGPAVAATEAATSSSNTLGSGLFYVYIGVSFLAGVKGLYEKFRND